MFKIFDEKEKKSEVILRLVKADGTVQLAVVDDEGSVVSGGYLLAFNEDGTFTRRPGVRVSIGVKVLNNLFVERK